MKHITQYNALQEEKVQKPIDDTTKQVLNALWGEIKANRPSFASQIKSKDQIQQYLLGFEKAFRVNRIDTLEKLEAGLERFYRESSSFVPTPAQFALWCKEEYSNRLHFKQLEDNMKRITDEKRLLGSMTFEERAKVAKENTKELLDIVARNKSK